MKRVTLPNIVERPLSRGKSEARDAPPSAPCAALC
jgi:hypothetical protein